MADIHPAVRISTPRAPGPRESAEAGADQRTSTVGGWLDAVEMPDDGAGIPNDSFHAPTKNGSFVNAAQLEAADAAEHEQSVIHSPVDASPKFPESGPTQDEPQPSSSPVLGPTRDNDDDDEVLQDFDQTGSGQKRPRDGSTSSSSTDTSSSSDEGSSEDEDEDDESDEGSSSSTSDEEDEDDDDDDSSSSEEDNLEAHLPKPRKQSLRHRQRRRRSSSRRRGDEGSSDDDDEVTAAAAGHGVVPPLSLTMNGRSTVAPMKPRPPSTDSQLGSKDFRRRAATAPSASGPSAEDEVLNAAAPKHQSTARAPRGRLGAALSAARNMDDDDDDDDDETNSSVSDDSSTTTTDEETTSTTEETATTSQLDTTSTTQTTSLEAGSPSIMSPDSNVLADRDLDDDKLYAKLVGLSVDSPSSPGQDLNGVRERRLRTLLGNVWRQSRASRRASPAAKLQEDAVRDLLKVLTRDRHQYREAARREREHRREALDAAEKAQRVVDGLIARGLSKGASGTSALVNNLPGSESIEARIAKKKQKRKQSVASSAPTEDAESTPKKKSSSKRRSSSSETPKKAHRTVTPADKKMTATMPASTVRPAQVAGDADIGNTPRPLRQKAAVSNLDANALRQPAVNSTDHLCVKCSVEINALKKQLALLQAENEQLRQQAHRVVEQPVSPAILKPGSAGGAVDGERTMPAKRPSKKKKSSTDAAA